MYTFLICALLIGAVVVWFVPFDKIANKIKNRKKVDNNAKDENETASCDE